MTAASFEPVHGDHATDLAIVQLLFDAPLDAAVFAAAEAHHATWRDELPVMRPGGSDPVRLPGFLALPPQAAGVSFAHLRPDGLPAWQLRFDPGSLSLLSTRYIRWERFRQTALRYAARVLDLLGDRRIVTIMLQIADRFEAAAAGYDATALLRVGPHVPSGVLKLGPAWHNNMGWFDRDGGQGRLLHNLNLASDPCRRPPSPLPPDIAARADRVSVGITHIQELRLAGPLAIATRAAALGRLDQALDDLHARNRALVAELLKPDMAQRIGLAPMRKPDPAGR